MSDLSLESVIAHLNELQKELRELRAVKEWAIKSLGVEWEDGGRVRLTRTPNTDNGWKPYRECLVKGAEGTASAPFFSSYSGEWLARFMPDREWSVGDVMGSTMRFWNGRADETPEGYEPPSPFDQQHYPDGNRHTFVMRISSLEAIS